MSEQVFVRIPNERGDLGKYDAECEALVRKLAADGTAVVVINGSDGSGFSISAKSPEVILALAIAFEGVAVEIRRKLQ